MIKKIANLYAGPYRGNLNLLNNHKMYFNSYDWYVSCFYNYKNDWLNSGWNIKEIFNTPFIEFKDTEWFKYRNTNNGQSGFWQFWNIKNVINNTKAKEYDFYIKNRCDIYITDPSSLYDIINNLEYKTFYCPKFYFDKQSWDKEKSINDQFYICDKYTMDIVSYFVDHYFNVCVADIYTGNEIMLRNWLNYFDINIISFDMEYIKDYDDGFGSGFTGNWELHYKYH